MAIMTHAKFHFNRLMLTLIFGIWASEPSRAWQTAEKAGPDRAKRLKMDSFCFSKSDNTAFIIINSYLHLILYW